jgi:hypothetical protein
MGCEIASTSPAAVVVAAAAAAEAAVTTTIHGTAAPSTPEMDGRRVKCRPNADEDANGDIATA